MLLDWFAAPMAVVAVVFGMLAGWILHLQPRSRLHRALALLLVARGLVALLLFLDSRLLSLENRLAVYALLAIPFAAANVAYLYWRRGATGRRLRIERFVVRTMLLVLLLATEAAYLLDHGLYRAPDLSPGPLALFFPASLASFALVGLAAAIAWRRAAPSPLRQGHFVVALAFLVEPAHESGLRVLTWLAWDLSEGWLSIATLVVRIGMVLLVLASLAVFAVPARDGTHRVFGLGVEERTAALVVGVPLLTGIGVFLLLDTAPAGPAFVVFWIMNAFWLLAMALGLTYAIVRYQVLESRRLMSFAVRQSTFAAVVGVLFVVTSETLEVLIDVPDRTAAIGVAVALAAAFRLLQRLTGTLVQRLVPLADDQPEVRPHEVYRAALEGLLVDGRVSRRERMALDALVAKLRLDPEEARRLEEEVLVRFAAAG